MKVALVLAVLVGVALADPIPAPAPTFGWIQRYGIPLAERIRKGEESNDPTRIVNGQVATLGQFPHQIGLISDIIGIAGQGVCGGALISSNRGLTAGHCWYDGRTQAWRFTIILGSLTIFTGGTRLLSTEVVTYPTFDPIHAMNDIAVIYLPTHVPTSSTIAPISLPSGSQLSENFSGNWGISSGYGQTGENININTSQVLSWANLRIIHNNDCISTYPFLIGASKMCVSTADGTSFCRGDSGGPLTVERDNRPILVGVISFYYHTGCESLRPAAYTRITSYMDFIRNNM